MDPKQIGITDAQILENSKSMNHGKVFEELKTFSNRKLVDRMEKIIGHLQTDRLYNRYHPEIEEDLNIIKEELLSRMNQPDLIKLEVRKI